MVLHICCVDPAAQAEYKYFASFAMTTCSIYIHIAASICRDQATNSLHDGDP